MGLFSTGQPLVHASACSSTGTPNHIHAAPMAHLKMRWGTPVIAMTCCELSHCAGGR